MEDIIDALKERHTPIPVPLELPDYDDLVEIEEQILIPLPEDYKIFLMTVSDVVFGSLEPATVMDPSSHTYLPEMAAHAWDIGLPRELIPICEARGGGYYHITEGGEIGLWQGAYTENGPGQPEDGWPSIWHWAQEAWLG